MDYSNKNAQKRSQATFQNHNTNTPFTPSLQIYKEEEEEEEDQQVDELLSLGIQFANMNVVNNKRFAKQPLIKQHEQTTLPDIPNKFRLIKEHYSDEIMIERGVVTMKSHAYSPGVKRIIIDSGKNEDAWKEDLKEGEYTFLGEIVLRDPFSLPINWKETDKMKLGTAIHDHVIKSINLSAFLGMYNLRPINFEEFPLCADNMNIKYTSNAKRGYQRVVGSIDLICLDKNDEIVLCDFKTSNTEYVKDSKKLFTKKAHKIQLELYARILEKMSLFNTSVSLKVSYNVIFGADIKNMDKGLLSLYLIKVPRMNDNELAAGTSFRDGIIFQSK